MTTSEVIRLVLIVALVVFLIAWRLGVREWWKESKEEKKQQEEDARQAERREAAREKARRAEQARDRRTSQILKLDLEGLAQKSIDAAGMKLWYLEGGETNRGPTVLLLHGFASRKEDWRGLALPLLQAGCHVVAPDLPGFGQNVKDPDANYEVTTQAKRMRAFTRARELGELHLVGSSLGGAVAAAYAYAAADEVQSLTLIETFGVRVPYESELDRYLARGINPLTVATPEAYDNLLGFVYEAPPELPAALKQHLAREAAANRDFYLKMWPQIRGGERAHLLDLLLPEIKARMLVVQGEKSKVVHPSTAQMIANMVRGTSCVMVEGCGHFPAAEKPEETARHLIRFLTEVPVASPPRAT